MVVVASMIVERTERGDDMFMTVLERTAQQALDLDALDAAAGAGRRPPPALRPEPADEGRHEPGPEALWNESWYFDAVATTASLGVYVRLGRLPNQGTSCLLHGRASAARASRRSCSSTRPRRCPPADDDAQAIDTERVARRAALRGAAASASA